MRQQWNSRVFVHESIAYLILTHPDGRNAVHLFDADLADEVAARHWCPSSGYAVTRLSGVRTSFYLHWLALGLQPGRGMKFHVDHINRDSFDSRRNNLRSGSARANHYNQRRQSAYGVCINPGAGGYYSVRVRFAGARIFHPAFRLLADAVETRDEYLMIANAVDAGRRPIPTRDELRSISDRLRTPL